MHKHDDDLNSFFTELRAHDKSQSIPAFEEMIPSKKKGRVWYLIPAGVAASLLIGLSIFSWTAKESTLETDNTVLILNLDVPQTHTDFLIEAESSVYAWKPGSNSLISDF